MARTTIIAIALGLTILLIAGAFLFWRYVWFFRNPLRSIPRGDNIVSPADGTVVYVKFLKSDDDVVVIKRGVSATISDIVKTDVSTPKILIGIFMSPLDVHYNRSPIKGKIESINHYPAKIKNLNMGPMQFRTLFHLHPYYWNSLHILENERTVTRILSEFKGQPIFVYVVQIAGGHVSGIDTYLSEGSPVGKGEIFGMIRIGSQVDLILPLLPDMKIKVLEGVTVRAGESVLVE